MKTNVRDNHKKRMENMNSTKIGIALAFALGLGGMATSAMAANSIFKGNVTKIEVRTSDYGGSDMNMFFEVTSNSGMGVKMFRILTATQNEKNALSTVLGARSMQAEISVFYDNSCSSYCNAKSISF